MVGDEKHLLLERLLSAAFGAVLTTLSGTPSDSNGIQVFVS